MAIILLFLIYNSSCKTNNTKYIEINGNVLESQIEIRKYYNSLTAQDNLIKYKFKTELIEYIFIKDNNVFRLILDSEDMGQLHHSSRTYIVNGDNYIVYKLLNTTEGFDSSVIYYLVDNFGVISIENNTWGSGISLFTGPKEIKIVATLLNRDIEFRSEHWNVYDTVPSSPVID